MGDRTKRIFISDIHMGDARSMDDTGRMGGAYPYCWFTQNIKRLADFLDEKRNAADVKEVVILGDLFDEWVIPINSPPLTSFENIYSNNANKDVIDSLTALAADSQVKLAYVPGNHDMSMFVADISQMKSFMSSAFPGIRVICDANLPQGVFRVGSLAAEHGHAYALFNAPDIWTNPDSFLPLGYFVSRIVADKVSREETGEDPRKIFLNFLKEFITYPADFIEDMFWAIVKDAGLKSDSIIDLSGIKGFPASKSIKEISDEYKSLARYWKKTPGKIASLAAAKGDLNDLSVAASLVYFDRLHADTNIVIFGHTHEPFMDPHALNPAETPESHDKDEPWLSIYANCGTWVDKCEYGCTYVETEEVPDKGRHYVRVIQYPSNSILHEGFVAM